MRQLLFSKSSNPAGKEMSFITAVGARGTRVRAKRRSPADMERAFSALLDSAFKLSNQVKDQVIRTNNVCRSYGSAANGTFSEGSRPSSETLMVLRSGLYRADPDSRT